MDKVIASCVQSWQGVRAQSQTISYLSSVGELGGESSEEWSLKVDIGGISHRLLWAWVECQVNIKWLINRPHSPLTHLYQERKCVILFSEPHKPSAAPNKSHSLLSWSTVFLSHLKILTLYQWELVLSIIHMLMYRALPIIVWAGVDTVKWSQNEVWTILLECGVSAQRNSISVGPMSGLLWRDGVSWWKEIHGAWHSLEQDSE